MLQDASGDPSPPGSRRCARGAKRLGSVICLTWLGFHDLKIFFARWNFVLVARGAFFVLMLWRCVGHACVGHAENARNEGREIRTPNLLIWSQTRCRCTIPPMSLFLRRSPLRRSGDASATRRALLR